MRIDTKKVFIADDGEEFDTLEKCQAYESSCIGTLESEIVNLTRMRNNDIVLKNRYKANRYGKLAMTEKTLLNEYKWVKKMMKVPIDKMSFKEIETLEKHILSIRLHLLQRKQQKEVLEDLRISIKEKGEQIKDLYEKLVKLKLEKLNS